MSFNRFLPKARQSVYYLTIAMMCTACALLVYSCGFHLRSQNVGSYIDTVALKVVQAPQLRREMINAFKVNDVAISTDNTYDVLVEIVDHGYRKNTSLVVPRQGLIEYELTLDVNLKLVFQNPDEEVSLTLEETGRVRVNSDKLLSTAAEEERVRVELNTRIVDKILNNLYLRLRQRQ